MTHTPEPSIAPVAVKPEQVPVPALPYSFKTTLSEYRKRLGVPRILIAFAITFLFWLRWGPVVWLVSVIFLAAILGGILYWMASRRVTVQEDGFEFSGWLSRKRTVAYSQIEGVKVFINFLDAGFGVSPRVSIAVKDAASINLSGLYWNIDDLDKLLAVLNSKKVAIEYYDDIVQYGAIAAQFPQYASYVERHTGRVAFIVIIAIIVIVGGIATLITLS